MENYVQWTLDICFVVILEGVDFLFFKYLNVKNIDCFQWTASILEDNKGIEIQNQDPPRKSCCKTRRKKLSHWCSKGQWGGGSKAAIDNVHKGVKSSH